MQRFNKGLDKRGPHGSRGGSMIAPAADGCKRVLGQHRSGLPGPSNPCKFQKSLAKHRPDHEMRCERRDAEVVLLATRDTTHRGASSSLTVQESVSG